MRQKRSLLPDSSRRLRQCTIEKGSAMDEDVSTIQHTLVLRRVEPERNMARFYALMIERDLFGHVVLVRHWGRIGTRGRERTDPMMRSRHRTDAGFTFSG